MVFSKKEESSKNQLAEKNQETSERTKTKKENKLKDRYSLNFKDDPEKLNVFHGILESANDKNYGSTITAKDIAMVGAKYLLKSKEKMEILKVSSRTAKEKALENLEKYNRENGTHYNIHEYQCAVLNLV